MALSSSLTLARLASSPSATNLSFYTATTTAAAFLRRNPTRLRLRLRLNTTTTAAPKISATIAVGDKLPNATLSYFDDAGDLQTTTVADLTSNKKTILFAVPGAFTPTCSQKHLPGFVASSADLKSRGVDVIACVSVNDAFVMKAWKKDLGIGDEVVLLSDGNGEFTRAIGAELDLSDKPVGLGVRSRRYALLAEDGVVKVLNLEEGGAFTNSSAEEMLKVL
ncbi:hypothetical protein Sjap_013585 [Stephania japonica]|uniref:Glutaredoxin-dependent peroxiredoxin n=1 Tax=Stephania japonica TaxID=461633 RepID=A0AAP0NYR2_9MAGN